MQNRKAFTMVELVFVIVVIGILSAVAIPKLALNRNDAEIVMSGTTLASVRNAIATERQQRILRGNFTAITDLGDATNAFSIFDANASNEVLMYPIINCASGATGCWQRVAATPTQYRYSFPVSGRADFVLQNNRLDCDSDATDCARLTN